MKIVIVGGGTGGHLYPALQIAEVLINKGNDVTFLGNSKNLEKKECEKRNVKFVSIPSKSTLKKDFRFFVENLRGVIKSLRVLKKIKPDVIYSTGGYTAAPIIAAANLMKIPFILHEQNAAIGLVHRLFRKNSYQFIHSYPYDVQRNEIVVGNISRFKGEINRIPRDILFVGGSGGAKTINDLAIKYADENPSKKVVLISGRNFEVPVKRDNLTTYKYVEELRDVLKMTDLAVARAGSTTLSEFSSLGIPTIAIPMPNSADNHQNKNADFYAEKNALIKISQDEYTYHTLTNTINKLSKKEKKALSSNFKNCYNREAENQIIEIILSV